MEGQIKGQLIGKRIIKKALISIVIVLVMLAFFIFFQFGNWRLNWSLQKINYQTYNHIGPDFSFHYPDYYQFDGDESKKFGDQYLGGFKLKTDQRTGCDLRINPFGLNFAKSDSEIENAIKNDLSKSAKEFKLISSQRTKIGNEEAFQIDFTFLDPTNNTVRLSQVLMSHAGTGYMMVCGTGEYQYQFFQKDFEEFFKNFRWIK